MRYGDSSLRFLSARAPLLLMLRLPPISTLFPYTTLFRSSPTFVLVNEYRGRLPVFHVDAYRTESLKHRQAPRSEEHTSELQSHSDLVCRLLLEKKKHE